MKTLTDYITEYVSSGRNRNIGRYENYGYIDVSKINLKTTSFDFIGTLENLGYARNEDAEKAYKEAGGHSVERGKIRKIMSKSGKNYAILREEYGVGIYHRDIVKIIVYSGEMPKIMTVGFYDKSDNNDTGIDTCAFYDLTGKNTGVEWGIFENKPVTESEIKLIRVYIDDKGAYQAARRKQAIKDLVGVM
jgi:hypothetical protein